MESFTKSELLLDFSDIENREFGFSYSGQFKRKMQFLNNDALIKFISIVKPKDCFVSVARYKSPCQMEGWLGSDLLFDFDSDVGGFKYSYADMINGVKVLREDFGLKNIKVNHTGSKGYHIIVIDDLIQKMTSGERQEVADYLTMKYKLKTLDTVCTCDIRRLRRLEGTVNSKTNRLCKRLKI